MKQLHLKTLLILLITLILYIVLPFLSLQRVSAFVSAELVNSLLTNPGIGWQETLTPDNPLFEESIIYRRSAYSWKLQNPVENAYNWSAVDNDMNKAITQGKQFSFRIYTIKGEGFGGQQIPQWTLDKGVRILGNGDPDYSNCTYQLEWGKFVEAMRLRYDGNPNIAFIDISGYGHFNEWSWNSQTTFDGTYDNFSTTDAMARKILADIFIGGSSTTHRCKDSNGNLKTISYSYPGFQKTQLIMPYAGIPLITRYVNSRRTDVGFRNDCLGRDGTYDSVIGKLGDVIEKIWPKAPVIFEFCGDGSTTTTLISESDKLLKASHGSIVHDNFTGIRSQSELNKILSNIGYKYVLDNYAFSGGKGRDFTLDMTWKNIGYAPSYPKMGEEFELHIYVISKSTGEVLKDKVIDTNISQWIPNQQINLSVDLSDVSKSFTDKQIIKTAIINKRTGKDINLPLTEKDSHNKYLIAEVDIIGNIKTTVSELKQYEVFKNDPVNLPVSYTTIPVSFPKATL
jgi:hypothetical protein